jgi:hydrogenase maturation protein HypF
MPVACSIKVRGVVQGVGFRPFVFRLARANALAGWVLNSEDGVDIFLEGAAGNLESFVRALEAEPPPATRILELNVQPSIPVGLNDFTIRESRHRQPSSARISPDLPVCGDCLNELFDPADARFRYPYINCTNCGPRYTVIRRLPYDRGNTTMEAWPLDEFCSTQYENPADRRFHAQAVACPACGPNFRLQTPGQRVHGNEAGIGMAAQLLRDGKVVAVKGLGGYHLACDASNRDSVEALRNRKYRKEKPFALMAKNLEIARGLVNLSPEVESLLTSAARPIVLAPARVSLPEVAPGNQDLGVMLPYTPVHYLLFEAGAPDVLVMTSANRSSEPIAYRDDEALVQLAGIADAFLMGERAIARRVDDSVARIGAFGPAILRRARGYAPGAVSILPVVRPILALGADLKNTITLVVHGQAFVSQHIGDLEHYEAFQAFRQTIEDFVSMYDVCWDDLLVVHDFHPQYHSTAHSLELPSPQRVAIQHHRAHIASVLAERQEWEKRIVGVSFDGAGYGDDGTIWGGEIFFGSICEGFERVAHLCSAKLAGGDAAARYPVQAAAGFLAQIDDLPDVSAAPFSFPDRYEYAMTLLRKGVRTFPTTSAGRLFDAAAALLGFRSEVTFEGQAAIWLEQLARNSPFVEAYPFPFANDEFDFRPLLQNLIRDRLRGHAVEEIARAFQRGIAQGLADAASQLCSKYGVDTIVLSGGVFQNELLLEDLKSLLGTSPLNVWTNHLVPPNDGGISLGQATLACFAEAR